MADGRAPRTHHISSAVVSAFPQNCADVVSRIEALPDTEIYRVENGRIVIVLEGASTGEIGARLTEIALMDGVLSANLVFEHVESLDGSGDGP
jgi:nitrate reductase NapD